MKKKITLTILVVLSIGCIYLAYYCYVWLIKPEESLVARLQNYSNSQGCFRCHQTSHKTSASKPEEHAYLYAKQEWEMYFQLLVLEENAKLGNYNKNKLYQGEMLARQYNCFLCHGKFGQGGVENQGGLKGYIPGWFGSDFEHLTNDNDKDKIHEWIATGMNQDILNLPVLGSIAQRIFAQQTFQMIKLPYLDGYEMSLLVDYVAYLHELGEITPEKFIQYQDDVRNSVDENIQPIQVELIHD